MLARLSEKLAIAQMSLLFAKWQHLNGPSVVDVVKHFLGGITDFTSTCLNSLRLWQDNFYRNFFGGSPDFTTKLNRLFEFFFIVA